MHGFVQVIRLRTAPRLRVAQPTSQLLHYYANCKSETMGPTQRIAANKAGKVVSEWNTLAFMVVQRVPALDSFEELALRRLSVSHARLTRPTESTAAPGVSPAWAREFVPPSDKSKREVSCVRDFCAFVRQTIA